MTNRALASLFAVAAVAVLAACTTGTPSAGGDSSGSGDASASDDSCPTVAGLEYFSDPLITTTPEEGQIFGDGTSITFEGPTDIVPQYLLHYVDDDGEAHEISNSAFDPSAPEGTYTTVNSVFDSDANGHPGIFELFTVEGAGISGGKVVGDTVVLGRYCVSIKTE